MIKATDLMIGDWVKCKDPKCEGHQVDLIDLGNEEVGLDGEIDNFENIIPIPLTPEILKKNGFNKPQDAGDGTLICGMAIGPYKLTFQSVFGLPILRIENVVDNDNYHTCMVLKDEIYNVHELQHALKSCGIKKEIVL